MEVIKYLIQFEKNYDDILINVNQTDYVNRPNNMDDYDLINDYIRNHYGEVEYKIICLDAAMEEVNI